MPASLTNTKTLTSIHSFHTLTLPKKAVDFPHLIQCSLRPPLLINDSFNFLAKRLDILRIGRKEEECMSEALQLSICYVELRLSY
jgi:hypothetical protein